MQRVLCLLQTGLGSNGEHTDSDKEQIRYGRQSGFWGNLMRRATVLSSWAETCQSCLTGCHVAQQPKQRSLRSRGHIGSTSAPITRTGL